MSAAPAGFSHRIVLVRHGETEWSRDHKHTGRTDIPLTDTGREQAKRLRSLLSRWTFAAVYVSPLQRARETCELAGFGEAAQPEPDLVEWDYGSFDGMTTDDIRRLRPGWNLWKDGPGDKGESLEDVAMRTERVLLRARGAGGDVLLVAHGHVLRVLTARWLEQPPSIGQRLQLDPASPSLLGHEHEWTTVQAWNLGAA